MTFASLYKKETFVEVNCVICDKNFKTIKMGKVTKKTCSFECNRKRLEKYQSEYRKRKKMLRLPKS